MKRLVRPFFQCSRQNWYQYSVTSNVLRPFGTPRMNQWKQIEAPTSVIARDLVSVSKFRHSYEDNTYWDMRWTGGSTIWHKIAVDELLEKHYDFLKTDSQCSILVPLCGKSLDMKWLAEQGHSVVGIDIVELAAQQFFTENDLPFNKYTVDDFSVYESTNDKLKIKFLVGDLFNCTSSNTGYFDAIWDCNSIVAVNPQDTKRYVHTLDSLLKPHGHILLSTYEFEDSQRDQSPHNLPPETVKQLFGERYDVTIKETLDHTAQFCMKYQIPQAQRHLLYLVKRGPG